MNGLHKTPQPIPLRISSDSYALGDYASMIADRVRMDAYCDALRAVVTERSIVLDIGTGAGVTAILACRLGARKVIAVEPNDAVHAARVIAAANGFESRIEFVQDVSTRISLDQRADVIVSDLRGILPLRTQHIASLIDARERLLAPGGWLIPWRDTLWGTVVEAPAAYDEYVGIWTSFDAELDMSFAATMVANTWWRSQLEPEQFLASPQPWVTLDYHELVTHDASGALDWTVSRAGIAHGLGMWFDAELAPGVAYSGAPGNPRLVYGHAFFPLEQPVPVEAGDTIHVDLRAKAMAGDYVWRWRTVVSRGSTADGSMAQFDQSTLLGDILSPDRLRRATATHVPALNDEGAVELFILSRMKEGIVAGDIATQAAAEYPGFFDGWEDAFRRVADICARYSK